ncbi:MAG: single-stranded DNA-binding protein [Planctomycetota bacterium]|nr:single-stranded DNA-binding protein [Planctomycetota bacterium]
MANYNRVILVGNLTRDPQLRYTPNQVAVCDIGLAINRQWSGTDGQKREEVCFVDCIAWRRQAETLAKYMSKGRAILVEGRLTFRSWDGPDGKKRSKHEVTVENFQFLDRPSGGAGEAKPNAKPQEEASAEDQSKPADYDFNQDVGEDTIPF